MGGRAQQELKGIEMKSLAILIVALVAVLVLLAGCGGGGDDGRVQLDPAPCSAACI